jgi:hypothetical protein
LELIRRFGEVSPTGGPGKHPPANAGHTGTSSTNSAPECFKLFAQVIFSDPVEVQSEVARDKDKEYRTSALVKKFERLVRDILMKNCCHGLIDCQHGHKRIQNFEGVISGHSYSFPGEPGLIIDD